MSSDMTNTFKSMMSRFGGKSSPNVPNLYGGFDTADALNNGQFSSGINAMSDEMFVRNVYEKASDFLINNRLTTYTANDIGNSSASQLSFGLEHLTIGNDDVSATIDADSLLDAARIPANRRDEAVQSLALLLAKFGAAGNSSLKYITSHFGSGNRNQELSNNITASTHGAYAPSIMNLVSDTAIPAMEAFGTSSDKVLPDIRAAIAVTLLRFHRGLADRILHRRVSDTPYVKYVQTYAEFYDMLKTNDADHRVRNDGSHRQPFINLYADPSPVSQELQPIVPLKANDDSRESVLVSDGVIKVGPKVNLFDLSRLANEFGKSHINWTDLVSEGSVLDSVYVEFAKGGTKETYQIALRQLAQAALNMFPNASDSADRSTSINTRTVFNKDSTDINGKPTELFASFTDNDFVRVGLNFHVCINNKTSDTLGYGAISFKGFNRANVALKSECTTALEGMTCTLIGYTIDARYSEENLRRSNLAIQTNVKTYDYEISNGRYILVDYSLQEEAPDAVMKFVSEAISLGTDHRAVDIITHQLMYIYDRNHEEATIPGLQDRLSTLGLNYAAGMMVRPTALLATIDLANVDTIRSSDILGDIRQYVEWQLLNLISYLNQNSYYKRQLNDGEVPKFKVVSSNIIIDNLLNIPHIHNHLNTSSSVSETNGGVEFRRVLPNGVELDCVSTTFNDLRDKMFIIPFRDGDPESVLNFGTNWDYGTFVGSYDYQGNNAVNKRFISNNRTQVIPTNPIGLYINVRNLDTIINMFATGTMAESRLPNPGDLVVPLV